MKKHNWITITVVFLFLSIFFVYKDVLAQETWREKILQAWKQRIEKKQDRKGPQSDRSRIGSGCPEDCNCKEEPCDNSRRLSPGWIDVWGTDFSDKPLTTEQAWDVIKVDSYLYTTGFIFGKTSDSDLFLRKYTEDGELLWEKTWDNGPRDSGLVITNDDRYLYVGGLTRSRMSKIYTNRALLQKYNFDGNLIWTEIWGDIPAGHHEIDGLAVVDNNLYVSHWDSFNGFVKGRATIKKFKKTDKTGNLGRLIWSRSYGDADKLTTADGHIYADETGVWIAGRINSYGQIPVLTRGDAYLTKFDSDGEQLWIKTFGGRGYDNALSLSSDDKYLYLTGFTQVDISKVIHGMDALITKFDRDGNKI